MPKNLTDVSEFTGDVVVPTDGDPADAASVEVAFQTLADRTRFLRDYCTDVGVTLPSPVTVHRYIGPASFVVRESDWGYRGLASPPDYLNPSLRSNANVGDLYLDLTPHMPRSAKVSAVRLFAMPGGARSPGSGLSLRVYGASFGSSMASPSISVELEGSAEQSGTGLQWLSVEFPGGINVSKHAVWSVWVYAGADGGSVRDYVYGARVDLAVQHLRND